MGLFDKLVDKYVTDGIDYTCLDIDFNEKEQKQIKKSLKELEILDDYLNKNDFKTIEEFIDKVGCEHFVQDEYKQYFLDLPSCQVLVAESDGQVIYHPIIEIKNNSILKPIIYFNIEEYSKANHESDLDIN